jgi:glycosyltransferase involved in cell wall biosynthesis
VVDGETGFLVDKSDVEATASAIGRLVDDVELRGRFGAQARNRALHRFSWEQAASHAFELYEEVLDTARR